MQPRHLAAARERVPAPAPPRSRLADWPRRAGRARRRMMPRDVGARARGTFGTRGVSEAGRERENPRSGGLSEMPEEGLEPPTRGLIPFVLALQRRLRGLGDGKRDRSAQWAAAHVAS